MKVKHNKKRNVGILFSQLSEYISTALVESREKDAHIALKILKKHFVKGSELYKEFRLFRALVTTAVPNSTLAASIISEAKAASRKMDISKLRQEKSALIKDINYKIAEPEFYGRRVYEYKAFATVQTLLNNWRSKDSNLSVVTAFETSLHEHLLKEKVTSDVSTLSTPDVNQLTVQIMQEKLQEKYGQVLSEQQSLLLKQYVFSQETNNKKELLGSMNRIKGSTSRSLDIFENECKNDVLKQQITEVRQRVDNLPIDNIDDSVMSQYLTLMKLVEELTPGGDNV